MTWQKCFKANSGTHSSSMVGSPSPNQDIFHFVVGCHCSWCETLWHCSEQRQPDISNVRWSGLGGKALGGWGMLLLRCPLYPDSLSQLCIDIIMKSLCCAWSLWRNLHMAGMADRKTKLGLKRISFVAHHLAAISSVMLCKSLQPSLHHSWSWASAVHHDRHSALGHAREQVGMCSNA
jgi:hypothetical protein